MLVIKRKRGEAFWIGQTRVVIDSLGAGKVRIAIEAPPGIQVLREELMVQEAGPKKSEPQK